VATEGEEVRVRAGDVVVIPAGEKHWHGATPTTAMAHLAIGTPGSTEVLE
jgi:quercetin dioxygenase-like cupin family protein